MTLETAKQKVRRKYLGEAGIHGVGVRRREGALCLYVSSKDDPELQRLLEAICADVSPYPVRTVEEAPASTTSAL
ncbi:MAG: hypothetical protein ACRCYY_19350 [Trueperaceae bacterium]